jgi:3-oxoacyl-(acyl-carrier-protein) synthase
MYTLEEDLVLSKRRVVVTGLGMLSPVGNTVEESWKNIVAGKSGIAPITAFDASEFSTRISGSVKGFDPTDYIASKDVKKMDTFIHFGIAAGIQALDDSGIEVTDEMPSGSALQLVLESAVCRRSKEIVMPMLTAVHVRFPHSSYPAH